MAYIYFDDSNYNVKIYCIRVCMRVSVCHLRIIDFIASFGLTIYLNLKSKLFIVGKNVDKRESVCLRVVLHLCGFYRYYSHVLVMFSLAFLHIYFRYITRFNENLQCSHTTLFIRSFSLSPSFIIAIVYIFHAMHVRTYYVPIGRHQMKRHQRIRLNCRQN